MILIQNLIICILILIVIFCIFYQYNYDAMNCKKCLENMQCQTNYIYDLY